MYVGTDVTWCKVVAILEERKLSVRVRLRGESTPRWIPRSCIVDMNKEAIGIASWFSKKEHIKGDW